MSSITCEIQVIESAELMPFLVIYWAFLKFLVPPRTVTFRPRSMSFVSSTVSDLNNFNVYIILFLLIISYLILHIKNIYKIKILICNGNNY